jgi:CRISPR system Cascade subunit CasC
MNTNPFKNKIIEFHILQSFPVTCLNRDDVGSPKSAVVGGTTRARVSSQYWKRQVRLAMHDLDIVHGSRTKLISEMVPKVCRAKGATDEQAKACGDKIEQIFIKKKIKNLKKAKKTKWKQRRKAQVQKKATPCFLKALKKLIFLPKPF